MQLFLRGLICLKGAFMKISDLAICWFLCMLGIIAIACLNLSTWLMVVGIVLVSTVWFCCAAGMLLDGSRRRRR